MLPVPYFTPVHKARRVVNQGVNVKTQRNGTNDIVDGSADDQVSEDDDENALALEGEPVAGQVNSESYSDKRTASRLTSESHEVPGTRSVDSRRKNAPDANLESLRPPLLAPQLQTSSRTHLIQRPKVSSARQRHLAVLAAIMHRSLLQHDYVRAARAWSMILRSELEGQSVDLRHGCRWGLGAEILLQYPYQLAKSNERANLAVGPDSDALRTHEDRLTSAHFDKLKEYYDRLSLQYPYNKSFPHAIGPLDFRFAMYSIWIYACTHRGTRGAENRTATRDSDQQGAVYTIEEAMRQACNMSEELAELMSSPPYSDSEPFRNLKVMVDRWAADLTSANDGLGLSHELETDGN